MNLKRRAQNFGSKFDFVACINPFKVIQSFAYLLEMQLITKEGKMSELDLDAFIDT